MTHPRVDHFPKLPLRLILIVPFIIQIFAAVGLVGYLSLKNGERAVNDLANQLIKKVNNLVDQHLDSYLATPPQINQINIDAINLGLIDLKNLENTGHYFWKQMRVFNIGYINFAIGKGTGLGLSISRQIIVEKHGGSIEVNSILQQGTEFIIKLYI